MQHETIKQKVLNQLEMDPMGDTRLWKYLLDKLGSEEAVREFLSKEGYPNWLLNKIPKMIEHRKKRYQMQKLNSANNI